MLRMTLDVHAQVEDDGLGCGIGGSNSIDSTVGTLWSRGSSKQKLLLRFGRGAAARSQRDSWFGCIELMRRAYAHAYALASELPIARAAHCVACASGTPE